MTKWIPFKEGHLDFFVSIKSKDTESCDFSVISQDLVTLVENPANEVYSLVIDRKIVAIVGIVYIRKGIGEAFSLLSDSASMHKFDLCKEIGKVLKYAEDDLGYHRIQISIIEGFDKACKFAGMLGFEREGLMMGFGPNKESHYLYARVKWE